MAAYARRGQDVDAAASHADALALALCGMTYEANQTGLPAAMAALLPHAQHIADIAEARGVEVDNRLSS